MKRTYKIGQMLTVQEDMQVMRILSDTEETVKKGCKVVVGADKLLHYLGDGSIQTLESDPVVQGYDSTGLAKYITAVLKTQLPILEMLAAYEYEIDDLESVIESAFDEIGMC